MAAKSDFAQKLFHDLRLRKERMAAAQSSSNSKSMSRGSYGSLGKTYKGSRQIKALESVGSRSGNSFRSTNSRDNRSSFTSEDSSKQLVNAGQVGDLSAALAYAFGYGGNLSKMDASGNIAMINFLHQFGKRSMDAGNIEISSNFGSSRRNTHFPTFSYMHVSEIEKGVQKLNQVLRACSNGLKFQRFSIVGKKLLNGAMDLEESLRVLVNMQDASDYMMSNQRKNRIKLLEDDEEDDSESAKLSNLKMIDRPRFSFDKPSRNIERTKGASKNGIKQQLMALTYPEENTPRLDEKLSHRESNLSSHTRSASCITDYRILSTYLETKNGSVSSPSKPEKGRIPNVIAKLMGLEELPAKGDSKATQTELSSRRNSMMVPKKRAISVDSLRQDTENRPPLSTKISAASSEMSPAPDTRLMLKAETFLCTPKVSSKVVISEENSRWQDFDIEVKADARSVSRIATVVMDKGQNRIKEPDVMSGQANNKKGEEKNISTKTAERKELLLNDELQYKSPERRRLSGDIESKRIGIKSNAVQTGRKNAGSPFLSKMQKNQHDCKLQEPQVLKKFERLEEKRKQQLPKQKLRGREPKGNQKESIVAPKAENNANGLQKMQPGPNIAMANTKKSMKHIDEKPLKGLSTRKNDVDHGVTEASITASQQQEKANRTSGTPNHSAKPLKTLSPLQQEMKRQIDNKIYTAKGGQPESETHSKRAETDFECSETEVSPPQPSNAAAESVNTAEDVTFHNYSEGEIQSLEVSKSVTSEDNYCEIAKEMDGAPNDCQQDGQLPDSVDDTQSNSMTAILTQHGGDREETTGINLFQDEPKKIVSSGTSGLLTESEKHLKEVFIKGQLFVNTAEALFKLDIPVGILHVMDQSDQDTQTKIILDCGYELLRKKGRRQELAVYPCKETSTGFVKVKSFDDLIKQLSKDFELLRSYGGKGGNDCDAADYLYKMLQKDIQNIDPDMNSMWDFGWDEKKFAFLEEDDTVRDVETHILNALLDEIINDLLRIIVSAAVC